MNLKEAYEKANDSDTLRRQSWGENQTSLKAIIADPDIKTLISYESAMADDWEIIPDKKEPITALQWYGNKYGAPMSSDCFRTTDILNTFKAGEENRDLLYVDLVEPVTDYVDGIDNGADNFNAIKAALNKIKQHKARNGNN